MKRTHSRKKECKGVQLTLRKMGLCLPLRGSLLTGVCLIVRAKAPSQLKGPLSWPQEREFLKGRWESMITKTPCHVERHTCFGPAKLDLDHLYCSLLYVTESPGSLCFPEVHHVPNRSEHPFKISKMAVVISWQGTFTENDIHHALHRNNVNDEADLCSRHILIRRNLH